MKKSVLRYGGYGALFTVAYYTITRLAFHKSNDYGTQEIFGWTGMVVSLLFIFFGIKYYRDHNNNGTLKFIQGLKVGVLIVLLPALAIALFDVLYALLIDPECTNRYYEYEMSKQKAALPPDQFAAYVVKMEKEKEFLSSPFVSFIVMFLTIFAGGVIISVISAFALRRRGN